MIDLHCHLDLYENPQQVARDCIARDVEALSVTTTPSAWRGTKALDCGSPRIHTALGLHPHLAHQRKTELPLFEQLVLETAFVGEIGLDGAPEFAPHWKDQMTVFTGILTTCQRVGGRILSVHSRRAATAVLNVLAENGAAGTPVLHWFSGSQRELTRAVSLGCWFSVGPAMLAGEKGRKLVEKMPRDRVLTESDGPFAQIDGRPILPWDVQQAVNGLGELWSESTAAVGARLVENLAQLLSCAPRL